MLELQYNVNASDDNILPIPCCNNDCHTLRTIYISDTLKSVSWLFHHDVDTSNDTMVLILWCKQWQWCMTTIYIAQNQISGYKLTATFAFDIIWKQVNIKWNRTSKVPSQTKCASLHKNVLCCGVGKISNPTAVSHLGKCYRFWSSQHQHMENFLCLGKQAHQIPQSLDACWI